MRKLYIIAALTLFATPALAQVTPIGVNGSRDNADCRPYTLAFTNGEAHTGGDDVFNSDLNWATGLGEDNAVIVAFDGPVEATAVRMHYYGYVLDAGVCTGNIEVVANGETIARVPPPLACRTVQPNEMLDEWTSVDLDVPINVTSIQLVDRGGQAEYGYAGYLTVTRVELVVGNVGPNEAIATAGSRQPMPVSGSVASGWTWSLSSEGAYVVQPDGSRATLDISLPDSGELWTVQRTGTDTAFIYAPGASGDAGSTVVFADASTATAETIATLPGPIMNAWYDECADSLRVMLEDQSEHSVAIDGTTTAL